MCALGIQFILSQGSYLFFPFSHLLILPGGFWSPASFIDGKTKWLQQNLRTVKIWLIMILMYFYFARWFVAGPAQDMAQFPPLPNLIKGTNQKYWHGAEKVIRGGGHCWHLFCMSPLNHTNTVSQSVFTSVSNSRAAKRWCQHPSAELAFITQLSFWSSMFSVMFHVCLAFPILSLLLSSICFLFLFV